MFARVSTYQGEPGSVEEATRVAREKILPAARELEGFAGVLILDDSSTGKSMSITLWQTEQALKASEEAANRLRAQSATEAGAQILGVERYEVSIDERA